MEEQELAKVMGERLLLLRNYYNLSQTDFAKKIGTRQRFVSEWESGQRMISTKFLYKISCEFNISVSHFFPNEEPVVQIKTLKPNKTETPD